MRLKGDLLRDARDRKGLTQSQLAEFLRMSPATINKAEQELDISVSSGRQICHYLGVNLAKAVIPREEHENGEPEKVKK